jgi:hypothetical protein
MDRSRSINPDAKSLEDAFFARENAKLLEQMRAKAERSQRRDSLRGVVGELDDASLDHLLELGIHAETLLALTLVPLARVAWADGSLDAKERAAIVRAADERGLTEGTPAHRMLATWLEVAPDAAMAQAWRNYVRGIWPKLSEAEREELRTRVLELSRGVAEAAGGFLGLGSKVSAAEAAVLAEIEAALR